jgi:hypothetical protein
MCKIYYEIGKDIMIFNDPFCVVSFLMPNLVFTNKIHPPIYAMSSTFKATINMIAKSTSLTIDATRHITTISKGITKFFP